MSYIEGGAVRTHTHGVGSLAVTNLTASLSSASGGWTVSLEAAPPGSGGGFAAKGSGSYTQNSGTIIWAASNNLTFGLTDNQMTASYETSNLAAAGHSHGNPSLSLSRMAGATASASGGFTLSLTGDAQSVQPVAASGSNGSFLFSTLQFVTGNGATFITDATGIRLSYTVPPGQSTQPVAVEGTNGSYSFSTLKFITGNGASFYTDASGVRLSYSVPSVPAQTVESQSVGLSNLATAGGGTGGTSGVASGGQVRYLFVAGSNVTLSQSVNGASGTMTLYAPAPGGGDAVRGVAAGASTLTTNAVNFSASNGISFGWGAAANSTVLTAGATASVYGGSNTYGTSSGTMALSSLMVSGVGAVQVAAKDGGYLISAPAQTAQPASYGAVSLGGNTAGTNTFHATNNSTLHLAGGSNITLSGNGSTVTIIGPTPGAAAANTLDLFCNFDLGVETAQGFAYSNLNARTNSVIVQPLMGNYDAFPGAITINTLYLKCSMSASTATMSSAHTVSVFVGIYTNNANTLSLLNSVVTTWGSNAGNANLSTVFAGVRWLSIGSAAWSAQPVLGQSHYYWGLMIRTAGQSYNVSAAFAGNTIFGSASATASGTVGVATVASATSLGMGPWYGVYATATASLPAAIQSNGLNKITDVAVFNPYLLMVRSGPTTF